MLSEYYSKLPQTLIKDRHRLKRQISTLEKQSKANPEMEMSEKKAQIATQIEASIALASARKATVPKIVYPDNLPVAQKKDDLISLIKNNQVVVIAGETGSGKTTQIPKMCLDAGQGVFGKIGCTQPRRLAARSVAERIAEELDSQLGDLVGYQVRFHDQVKQTSLLKVMTDGILLAEIQNDRFLNQYDTIIIDEAHERSINIDFLLGILKNLLPKRPDLKLVITSATIDTERFAKFFDNAPIVEVSGRTFPVELRYRPLSNFVDDEGNEFEQDLPTAILHALDELALEDPFGDVLVFQVGERDIKETADLLKKSNLKNTDIVPLYAKLSMAEQNKVFQTSQKRRVVLATNVAETSLTVPGIKFVIDPGFARISRYSVRSKVQRLPIEKISQASANQRKGRCGRVSDGVCIRLYEAEDFESRPAFTAPEIHRTSLATVILQMMEMRLPKVKHFPFIEPPEDKAINDGFRQLHEIGALDEKRQLTDVGKQVAKLPLDPRMAKMVIEGQKNNVLAEVLVIAAAISIQDPRDMNEETRKAASKVHEPFEDERSDFLFFLNLWHFYQHQRRHLSQNKLRKLCKTNYLSYLRMREWHDLYWQLESSLKRIGMKVGDLHLYEEVKQGKNLVEKLSDIHSIAVHRSLIAGLLGNIATREEYKSYLGARNTKLFIHPSSVLFKQTNKWILSGELIETTKLYARNNAAIDIRWVESLARHLIKTSYSDPHWQKKSGQVGAFESITLYGLPIVTKRRCNYGPVNPKESRKIFIQSALVNGELRTRQAFFLHNQKMMQQIHTIENKLRRPDYMVDEAILYKFYDSRIPLHIYNQPAFEKWCNKAKQTKQSQYEDLYLTEQFLLKQFVDDADLAAYPDQIHLSNQLPLGVEYQFEPGKQQDGVVFHIPLSALNLVDKRVFDWLTPGFLPEKITHLIKALPKQLRKQFVPVPQYTQLVLEDVSQDLMNEKGDFLNQLVWSLNRRAQMPVKLSDFEPIDLPVHLQPFYILDDHNGKPVAESDDLSKLKSNYLHLVEKRIQNNQPKKSAEKTIVDWDFGDLKPSKRVQSRNVDMVAFPALALKNDKLVLSLFGDQNQAEVSHGGGVILLLKKQLNDKERYLQKKLQLQKACLCFAPYGSCQDLTQQIIDKALAHLIPEPHLIRSQNDFEALVERVRLEWVAAAQVLAKQISQVLIAHQNIAKKVKGKINPRWLASITDIRDQLDGLVSKNFVKHTPEKWLNQMPRYLQGLEKRLEKIDIDPNKDQLQISEIQTLLDQYKSLAEQPTYQNNERLQAVRWMLEELRLSLFSQPLKTLMPVSIKRVQKALKEVMTSQ